ncbi:TadE/TadG family type IV pilus assembly protein [Sphingomonas xanthus]|uniref:Pilus assembly protein n=1 Tax=Sphingomonas xanthus TaxID=2594473 RepID=A0A516IRE6_9SPHN|nr:TadE family protein [Sphingomonas xanthus]QDP19470.1 pilus assembly protein [Sphingomonas xanthus]
MMQRLRLDRSGASAAEFALVLPLLLLFIFGIIDAGRFLWEFNRAEKATQMGVRYAVVTDMVPSTLASHNFALTNSIPGGDPVPISAFDNTVCDTSSCTNSWGYSAAAFDNIVARMNAMYPPITDSNVWVEYQNVGLGYAGDPNGPDVAPLVTVRLTGLTFQPLTFLLFGANITMPDFRAALTLEDGAGTVSN